MAQWLPNAAREALMHFLADFELLEPSANLISFRQTAIFRLPGIDASLRIYGPGDNIARADRMVALAKYLADVGFPAIRLHPAFATQPFNLAGFRASVWQWIEAARCPTDIEGNFGQLLRRFHDLPESNTLSLPLFDPIRLVRQRLTRLEAVGNSARLLAPSARRCHTRLQFGQCGPRGLR